MLRHCRRGKQSRHGMKRPERLCERRQCGVWMWVWMLLTDFIGLPDPAHLFVSQKRNIEMIALLDSLLFSGRRCREALRSLRSVSCCLVRWTRKRFQSMSWSLGPPIFEKEQIPDFAEKTKIRFGIFRYRVVRCRSCMAETVGLRDISRRRCSVRGSCAGVYG